MGEYTAFYEAFQSQLLFLCFLVRGMRTAPITKLLELNFLLNELLVLARPVILATTF